MHGSCTSGWRTLSHPTLSIRNAADPGEAGDCCTIRCAGISNLEDMLEVDTSEFLGNQRSRWYRSQRLSTPGLGYVRCLLWLGDRYHFSQHCLGVASRPSTVEFGAKNSVVTQSGLEHSACTRRSLGPVAKPFYLTRAKWFR
jgi:hypothetical protein